MMHFRVLLGLVLRLPVGVPLFSLESPYGLEPLVPQNLFPRDTHVACETGSDFRGKRFEAKGQTRPVSGLDDCRFLLVGRLQYTAAEFSFFSTLGTISGTHFHPNPSAHCHRR